MIEAIIDALYWIGLAGAVAGIVVYFVQIALRPQSVRLVNGAGLFFTGLSLAGMVNLLRYLPANASLGGALITVGLLAAVYFQSAASLRGRKGDRRTDRRAQAQAVAG